MKKIILCESSCDRLAYNFSPQYTDRTLLVNLLRDKFSQIRRGVPAEFAPIVHNAHMPNKAMVKQDRQKNKLHDVIKVGKYHLLILFMMSIGLKKHHNDLQ